MKRQLSSFDIFVIVDELQELIGSFIEKSYQLSPKEILVKVKNVSQSQKEWLYFRNGEFLCLTQKTLQTPERPSNFAMALRKYLQNGRIVGISQHEFDRILKIEVMKGDNRYGLIIELFSNGNIILIDSEDKIIVPLLRQSWAHRTVKGREPYIPPPSQIDIFQLSFDHFVELFRESTADLVRTLAVSLNLSGPIAEEICLRARIEKHKTSGELDHEALVKIYEALVTFVDIFKKKQFDPLFVKQQGEIINILPFAFVRYHDEEIEHIPSFVRGFDVFLESSEPRERPLDTSKQDQRIGKLERQLNQQQNTVDRYQQESEIKKRKGDLIYLHFQEIESLLKEITQLLMIKEKSDEVQRMRNHPLVHTFDPSKNLLHVNLKDVSGNQFDVDLDFRLSVADNAQKAYEEHKKLQSKIRGAKRSILKTREHLASAQKHKQNKDKHKDDAQKTVKEKQFWFERFRWFISSEGNIVIGGRDARTNELIVKKYLKAGDRYAHADIQGAPSVVIKSRSIHDEHVPISEETLNEACRFAAAYSKAWKQFMEAQAYWVLPEQVSKTPQSGEFVPKGAFIIRGKRNYSKCKLELAVGMVKVDDVQKIMVCPPDTIKSRTKTYVVFQPGDITKNSFAKQIAKIFHVSVDTVESLLPPGGVMVLETVGVTL
jgi:predicted ribosome quality control (RQC) complex YloA/Tae2 family protein